MTSDPSSWFVFYEQTSVLQYCWDPVFCEQQGINYDDVIARIKADLSDADILVIEATEMNEDVQFEYAKVLLDLLREGN